MEQELRVTRPQRPDTPPARLKLLSAHCLRPAPTQNTGPLVGRPAAVKQRKAQPTAASPSSLITRTPGRASREAREGMEGGPAAEQAAFLVCASTSCLPLGVSMRISHKNWASLQGRG